MADLTISAVAFPVSAMSNAFSGLFGGSGSNDYSTMRLLNIQMQMLENMSSKIDVIQTGIEFIIENQEETKQLIEKIPSKTVSELYRKDLEGLFVLVREKIEAYVIERAKNKEKANKIFQPIFNEILTIFQVSRAKIFRLDNYLDLPVVSTCLHFEIFCMVLAEQPKSLIEVTLKSYRKWIQNCIDSDINSEYEKYRNLQTSNVRESKKVSFSYSRCLLSVEHFPGIPAAKNDPGGGSLPEDVYTVSFTKFLCEQKIQIATQERDNASILIKKELILEEELPSTLELGDIVWTYSQKFVMDDNGGLDEVFKVRVNNDFEINITKRELSQLKKCADSNLENNPHIPNVAEISFNLTNNGHYLITYASLLNIALESIQAIDKFLAEPQSLNKDSILSFGYELENVSRIYNDRAVQWIKFIDDKVEQIEDDAQKEKIKALRDEMANLKANEKNILLDYKNLEEELARNMPDDLLSAILKLLEPIGKELERGVQNLGREAEILAQNLGGNLEKAAQDIGKQLEKDVQNTGDLFVAVEGYVENQVNALGDTLTDAEKRIREGKIIDALWHLGTDQIKHTEENAFTALQQSSLLNSIASSVVTIYGAPYGGAVYAAWFTYKQTGSLELALKTAVITYLTSEGMAHAKEIPDIAQRTLMTSAVAATAIAASGGTEKDIIDGFLKGTALAVASESYKNMTTLEIEGKSPTQGPLDKQELLKDKRLVFLNKKGQEVLDITKLSRDVSHVGLDSGAGIFSEKGYPLQMFAKIPYMNDMAYFHDQWCAVEGFALVPTVVTIIPATILTVAGSERPVLDEIIETINEKK